MNENPTRFEATLNLMCAAMTMLFYGELTAEQEAATSLQSNGITPLRVEFEDVFRVHKHYTALLCPIVCPDLGPGPYYYTDYRLSVTRLRFLLDLRCRPSSIIEAVRGEFGTAARAPGHRLPTGQHERVRRLAHTLGVESRDVYHCWREQIDLDRQWDKLRAKLIEIQRGMAGVDL